MYNNDFKDLIRLCISSKMLVGEGNTNSNILIVGKEGSNHEDSKDKNIEKNLEEWDIRLKDNIIKEFRYDVKKAFPSPGHTWRKYQILHDFIYKNTDKEGKNFENHIFTTEINDSPAKRTAIAQQDSNFIENITNRKSNFFTHDFIQNFDVVVLACSNYIKNTGKGDKREIDRIFKVSFHEVIEVLPKFKFWIHYNEEKTKLVIHCRQLSDSKFGSIPEEFFKKMGEVIKDFLSLQEKKS